MAFKFPAKLCVIKKSVFSKKSYELSLNFSEFENSRRYYRID